MFAQDKSGDPLLKGKAPEIRQLGPALLSVLEEGMDRLEPVQVAVRALLQASVDMDALLTKYPSASWLPPHDVQLLLQRTLS